MRLACVGRLFLRDKGQDVVLRTLALKKWRERALCVTFVGDGPNRGSLEALAASLGLTSVTFAGSTDKIDEMWTQHHGLILPSRAEGLPVVIVEAMLSNRIVITTDVGGNAEILDDDHTGFIATAPTVERLDEALERAWIRRDEWQSIGEAAGLKARSTLEEHPAKVFGYMLRRLADGAGLDEPDRGGSANPDRLINEVSA